MTNRIIDAFCEAAENDECHLLEFMLSQKVDIDGLNSDGKTALICAAHIGNVDVVELLLQHGANPLILSADGELAWDVSNEPEIDRLLREAMAIRSQGNDIFTLAAEGNAQGVAELLLGGEDVNAQTDNEASILMIATANNQLDVVDTLLEFGADASITDRSGKTALDLAKENGHHDIAIRLFQHSELLGSKVAKASHVSNDKIESASIQNSPNDPVPIPEQRTPRLLGRAIAIAATEHQYKFDVMGEPFILHPLRLMMKAKHDDERVVVLLREIVNKDGWTVDRLAKEGFNPQILAALDCIGHRSSETFNEYIDRIALNRLAACTILLDIEERLNLQMQVKLSARNVKAIRQYHAAVQVLNSVVKATAAQ